MRKIIAVLLLIVLGGCMPLHDQPDWLVGKDPIEAARRQVQGVNLGLTGELLYSTGFEDGLGEFIEIPAAGGAVQITSEYFYKGGNSLLMLPTSPSALGAGVTKYIQPFQEGRMGLEVFFRPAYLSVSGYQMFVFNLRLYNFAWSAGGAYMAGFIRTNASDDGKIYIYDGDLNEVDTGAQLSNLFPRDGVAYGDLYFHQFKLLANLKETDPEYIGIIVDGRFFDLSGVTVPQSAATYPTRAVIAQSYLFIPNNTSAKGYLDSMTVTFNEP